MTQARLKILVVTPRFSIAGVALAQIRFARALASAGHEVDLIIGFVEPELVVPETPGVNLIALQLPKVRQMVRPLIRYLRQSKPDVVFSAEDHLNAIVLFCTVLAGSKAKVSGSCRVGPFTTYSDVPLTKKWALKQLTRLMFWRADALTCVSEDMVGQYRKIFKSPPHVGVYNIIVDAASRERMSAEVDEPWLTNKELPVIIAAGTLSWRKGFDDLVAAVGSLHQNGRKVRLIILGEGHKRKELEAQVAALGIEQFVKMPGFTYNPLKYFSRADVFALTSRFEGLPNVLIEAMMCGCTPVAMDCPTGPREVLKDGKYGYIVPVQDRAAMARALEQALDHPIEPALLAEAIRPFEEKAVLRKHFEILGLETA